MKRVRAMLLLSALGLAALSARADETNWKPADTKPTPAPPPPPAADKLAAPPVPELSGWRPAMRYPVDLQTPTTPTVTPSPAPAPAAEPLFRPVATTPADPPPPMREVAPATLPPISPIPKPAEKPLEKPVEKPAEKPSDRPSELLPPPRPIPGGPKPLELPANLGSGIVPTPADCPPVPLNSQPGLMQAAGTTVPVAPQRGRTFGSPSLNLSRDFFVRDLFGLDLYTPPRAMVGPDGSVLFDGPAPDLFFFQAEYLMWWTNRYQIPVLATTSATPTGFGFLGDPNTRNLLGPGDFGPSFRNGMRIRAGGYLDDCESLGFDASFFFLGTARERAAFDSSRFPVITRPFFAPNTATINVPPNTIFLPGEFGEVVARPGLSRGRLEIDTDSYLWGADVNVRKAVCRTCEGSRGWFGGYRHLNLTERLSITEFITAAGPEAPDPPGTQVVVNDTFETRNRFHGGQLGYFWTRRAGAFDVDARMSVALGVTHQILNIDGFQRRTRPGEQTQVFRGGLLAAGPNIGRFTDSRFSVVPEATINIGFAPRPGVRLYVGYNFLYWSNVIRPGDTIDRTVDVTFVPNPPTGVAPSGVFRPQPQFRQSDLWAQGIQLGAELRW